MAETSAASRVQRIPASAGRDAILDALHQDGVVIIKGVFTPEQVQNINEEIKPTMDKLQVGSNVPDDEVKNFHGFNTKRGTGLVQMSKTFREHFLDNDLVHQLCAEVFVEDSGTYWLNTAQIIDIGPGSKAQVLHRDQWQFPVFTHCGPSGPEATINFILALTPFTEENGATRVIPGSHKWADFRDNGTPEQTVPAEMDAGDACLITGKVAHGGGANNTTDFWRRGIATAFQVSYLTPEEAYPFIIPNELAQSLSERAQAMIGYRSQFPKNSPGVWKCNYSDGGDILHAFVQ